MRARNTQAMAEAAAAAEQEAALVLAEIEKNDRLATLAARAAAARAARCAQEAVTYLAYAREFATSSRDEDAIMCAEAAAENAKKYATVAAEKAKWRSNPSNASAQSLLSQEQRFEDEIDEIEAAWDSGDIDSLVQLGALSPFIARHLKAEMRS